MLSKNTTKFELKISYPIIELSDMLYNLGSKSKWITGFYLLTYFKNRIFIFRFVKAPLASTWFSTVDSSSKAITITDKGEIIFNMTKHVYKCKLLDKFPYSFKHLVFLQLQRLQPSPSMVLEVFFLKNNVQFSG